MEQVRTTGAGNAVASIVGILTAAFVALLVYLLLDGGLTPEFVLWSGASIAISAFGGGLIYIVAALAR